MGLPGLTVGDFLTGTLSQVLRSRKLVVVLRPGGQHWHFLSAYFRRMGTAPAALYAIIFGSGPRSGYWAVFATIAAEQFGTNLRATVATTVPNFVRGSLIPISWIYVCPERRAFAAACRRLHRDDPDSRSLFSHFWDCVRRTGSIWTTSNSPKAVIFKPEP